MNSLASSQFWDLYQELPMDVRELAKKSFDLWRTNPRHPSLQFKPISGDLWSVRIGLHYRAVGKFQNGDTFLWIWIGNHDQYDRL